MLGTVKVITRFRAISTPICATCPPMRRLTMNAAANRPNTPPLAPTVPVSQEYPIGSARTYTAVCPPSIETK